MTQKIFLLATLAFVPALFTASAFTINPDFATGKERTYDTKMTITVAGQGQSMVTTSDMTQQLEVTAPRRITCTLLDAQIHNPALPKLNDIYTVLKGMKSVLCLNSHNQVAGIGNLDEVHRYQEAAINALTADKDAAVKGLVESTFKQFSDSATLAQSNNGPGGMFALYGTDIEVGKTIKCYLANIGDLTMTIAEAQTPTATSGAVVVTTADGNVDPALLMERSIQTMKENPMFANLTPEQTEQVIQQVKTMLASQQFPFSIKARYEFYPDGWIKSITVNNSTTIYGMTTTAEGTTVCRDFR